MATRAVNASHNAPRTHLNKRHFFDWLGRQFQVRKLDDWYKITLKQIRDIGAARHLKQYNNSIYTAVSTIYPEHVWHAWKFGTVPRGYWDNLENQKKFFDWLGQQLGVKQLDDWYNISSKQIRESLLGGNGLLYQYYNNSMYAALTKIYPDHDWQGWRFHNLPRGFLKDENKASKLLQYVGDQLHITKLDDWYRVSLVQLHNIGASFLVGKLPSILKEHYPDYPWQADKFAMKNKKATQRWLYYAVQQLFPQQDVKEDYSHPDLVYLGTNRMMQIDVYIPELKIAFEYQGEQHYYDVYSFAPQQQYSIHDSQKKSACESYAITYTEVPFWWNRTKESVASTLIQLRPDLPLQEYKDFAPIPKTFTPSHSDVSSSSRLMQALNYEPGTDVTGWYASEKYDGIRALWDGSKLTMRKGQAVSAPSWFIDQLPKSIALDGELWIGKNKHKELSDTVSKSDKPWEDVKFMIFDAPQSNLPYEQRMELLQANVRPTNNVQLVKTQIIQNTQHLNDLFNSIVKEGGEGLILRKPGSFYEKNRSPSMLKLKASKDTEVKFVKPHHRGGLVCEQPNGQQCIVRCSLEVQQNPPPVGALITVKHFGNFSSGKLKYPFFVKERTD